MTKEIEQQLKLMNLLLLNIYTQMYIMNSGVEDLLSNETFMHLAKIVEKNIKDLRRYDND